MRIPALLSLVVAMLIAGCDQDSRYNNRPVRSYMLAATNVDPAVVQSTMQEFGRARGYNFYSDTIGGNSAHKMHGLYGREARVLIESVYDPAIQEFDPNKFAMHVYARRNSAEDESAYDAAEALVNALSEAQVAVSPRS